MDSDTVALMKSLQAARDAAETTRRLADEHAWAHRDADAGNGAIAKRGAALKHAAATANGELLFVERAQRAAAVSKRRTEQLADDAGLQSRLRAEAQARSEETARRESPPPRGRGLR
jgi:hypothetical protein